MLNKVLKFLNSKLSISDKQASLSKPAIAVPVNEDIRLKREGDTFLHQGNLIAAETAYRQAILLNPLFAKAHSNLGFVLREMGRLPDAAKSLRQARELDSSDADTQYISGTLALTMGHLTEAETHFRQALAIASDFAFAYHDLVRLLLQQDRNEDALQVMANAVNQNADDANMQFMMGERYQELQRFALAHTCYLNALKIKPSYPEASASLATVLIKLGQAEQAYPYFTQAIDGYKEQLLLSSNDATGHFNLGSVLLTQNRCAEAKTSFDHALRITPHFPEARLGRSLANLAMGNFEEGWAEYNYNKQEEKTTTADNALQKPSLSQWKTRDDIIGKSIVLYADQGLGDTMQFVRYAECIRAVGAVAVYLDVQPQLKLLMETIPAIDRVLVKGANLESCDFQCSLSRLPHLLGTRIDTIPNTVPYIQATPERVTLWKEKLHLYESASPQHSVGKKRVGVVWSGNRFFKNDFNRSLPLSNFNILLQRTDVNFYSLQKDLRENDAIVLTRQPGIIDLTNDFTDMSETAATIANLDLIISVDTAIAHLAGAMGKPVWIMLPFASDFRWLLNRNDSPWYPTARLFRQQKIGDWKTVMQDIQAALDEWILGSD
ncbi:tetratricopeptide repeat protein [Undibacterium sp. TJN19]|uniref:tetratricopeptide repeat protein n=1 Tax=Undibacterium sp. TJN19 TaxID=3413055 RepID=UPI003BF17969